jgi:peroxiredoxin
MLLPGDPAPDFRVPSSVNPDFHFDTSAGRYIVLSFFATSTLPYSAKLLEEVERRRDRFNVSNAVFFGVSIDPQDPGRLRQRWPGVVYFWDQDRRVSELYGLLRPSNPAPGPKPPDTTAVGPASSGGEDGAASPAARDADGVYEPATFVLDQALRVLSVLPFRGEPAAHVARVFEILDAMPPVARNETPAPVLVVPLVFEPELCRELIDYYLARGAEDSGFMRDVDGKTVAILDYSHKRRRDCEVVDPDLIRRTQERLSRRVVPAIRRAFQFDACRIERHIVACYDAAEGGHFRAHRDNTTLGTAHRRFAVTQNLNSDEFEGGELWFPEFGPRRYKAPTGGAVVFSCSLLHEATPVTRGRRYAFLPFLYDDAAARVRERNHRFVAGGPALKASGTS